MPITIKSTELKYKNPSTGQYQGIDAVAERTTSEQCALIEAKGAETIASIPSDYTTLSDTVDDLTSDVSDLNGAITSNETKILNTQNALAKNITSTTATETLYKGDIRFNRTDGRVWRITDTIQSGDQIIGGGNAQSLTLGSMFENIQLFSVVVEFTNGAGNIYDRRIGGPAATLFVQARYEDGGDSGAARTAKTLFLTPQAVSAGRAVVYARNPDGTIPPSGTKIYCSVFVSNFT